MEELAYPLAWPPGWPRTPAEERARPLFKPHTLDQAARAVEKELERLGVTEHVISSNLALGRRPKGADPGIAVYFTFRGEPRVLACDRWPTPEANLWAVHLHIDALRGIERWGVGSLEQAFAGYTALPEHAGGAGWWEVLGVTPSASVAEVEYAYKRLAKSRHPDTGGDGAAMAELNLARAAAHQATGKR